MWATRIGTHFAESGAEAPVLKQEVEQLYLHDAHVRIETMRLALALRSRTDGEGPLARTNIERPGA